MWLDTRYPFCMFACILCCRLLASVTIHGMKCSINVVHEQHDAYLHTNRGVFDTRHLRALSYTNSTIGTHQTNDLNGIWRVSIGKIWRTYLPNGYTFSHRVFDGIPNDNQVTKKNKKIGGAFNRPNQRKMVLTSTYHLAWYLPAWGGVSWLKTKCMDHYTLNGSNSTRFTLSYGDWL